MLHAKFTAASIELCLTAQDIRDSLFQYVRQPSTSLEQAEAEAHGGALVTVTETDNSWFHRFQFQTGLPDIICLKETAGESLRGLSLEAYLATIENPLPRHRMHWHHAHSLTVLWECHQLVHLPASWMALLKMLGYPSATWHQFPNQLSPTALQHGATFLLNTIHPSPLIESSELAPS